MKGRFFLWWTCLFALALGIFEAADGPLFHGVEFSGAVGSAGFASHTIGIATPAAASLSPPRSSLWAFLCRRAQLRGGILRTESSLGSGRLALILGTSPTVVLDRPQFRLV